MREILITEECRSYIEEQPERVRVKFYELIEVIGSIKVVSRTVVKKLTNTEFYELRIRAGNEFRVIVFSIDRDNFIESTKAVCLNGFLKKSTKDYTRAIRRARRLLDEYEITNDEE